MTSQAKVNANRRNAQKSTGPRTEQGKAIVAQNAIKHGLLARRDVIIGEDAQEFALFRDGLLGEMTPVGPRETLLAGRMISLAWRLKRAERYQNQLFDYLLTKELERSLSGFDDMVSQEEVQEMTSDPETDPHLAIGRVLASEYNGKVLERLMVQERRIESSLYRTMKELRLASAGAGNAECGVRNAESGAKEPLAAHEIASMKRAKQSQLPAEGQSVLSVETQYLASGPAEAETQAPPTEPAPSPCETKPTEAAGTVCCVPARASGETPCSVTTNGTESAKQSQPPKPAKGFDMVPRHARYAWYYHSPGR